MTTFEDLLYRRMTENETLKTTLAKYRKAPAVFYQTAPDDTAKGWNQGKQYPRIDYVVDYISNPERKTSGILTLNIMSTEDGTPPEELDPIVRQLLCGIFITPDNAPPYSLAWSRSDTFDQDRSNGDGIVIGITLTFDVYAFPLQTTTDPDPVLAMNHYIERLIPAAEVIGGLKPTGQIYTPTPEAPAFYFRLETLQMQRETNTVAWMDCTIICHIFAGGEETTWLKYIVNELALAGEVIMLDTSPMFLRNLQADNTLDALATGQLRLYVRFGILRRPPYSHPLINANREYKNTGGD